MNKTIAQLLKIICDDKSGDIDLDENHCMVTQSELEKIENTVLKQALDFIYKAYSLVKKLDLSDECLSEFENTLLAYPHHKIDVSRLKTAFIDLDDDGLESFQFEILSQKISCSDFDKINLFLKHIHSKLFILWGKHADSDELIVGEATVDTIDSYDVYYVHKEYGFTPNVIIPMAAMINKQTICIRLESIKQIVKLKWHYFNPMFIDSNTIAEQCSYAMRSLVLDKVGKSNIATLETIIKDNVLYHELGHSVIQYDFLDLKIAAFAESFQFFEDNIVIMLLEVCADFAPKMQRRMGVLTFIAELSESDKDMAEIMFWVYVCDVWFYDTELTYMYSYSDCMLLLIARYLNKDYSIDFKTYKQEWDMSSSSSLINQINQFLNEIITEFIDTFKLDYSLQKKDISDEKQKRLEYNINSQKAETQLKSIQGQYNDIQIFLKNKQVLFFEKIINKNNCVIQWDSNEEQCREDLILYFKQYLSL